MGIVSLIVNYRNLEDAVEYIRQNKSKIRVDELNDALRWAGINPKKCGNKESKIYVLIDYLENEYKR